VRGIGGKRVILSSPVSSTMSGAAEGLVDELESAASDLSARFPDFGEAARNLFALNFAAPIAGGAEGVVCRHHLNHASYGTGALRLALAA